MGDMDSTRASSSLGFFSRLHPAGAWYEVLDMTTTTVISVTPEELDQLVQRAVLAALREHHARPDADALLSTKEAAALIGVTPNALAVAISRRKYPNAVVRNGRSIRLKRQELLDAWEAAR